MLFLYIERLGLGSSLLEAHCLWELAKTLLQIVHMHLPVQSGTLRWMSVTREASPIIRDMRISSAQLLGETGASSSSGSFHFGFHSHLQPLRHLSASSCLMRQCSGYIIRDLECNDGALIDRRTHALV